MESQHEVKIEKKWEQSIYKRVFRIYYILRQRSLILFMFFFILGDSENKVSSAKVS